MTIQAVLFDLDETLVVETASTPSGSIGREWTTILASTSRQQSSLPA